VKETDNPPKIPPLILLVADPATRESLFTLLAENRLSPIVSSDPEEVVTLLKAHPQAFVFLDCESVIVLGSGLYSRFKVASPTCRVIMLCDKGHLNHQGILREAMEMGAYACLLAPYKSWEVLAMLRPHLVRKPSRPKPAKRQRPPSHDA